MGDGNFGSGWMHKVIQFFVIYWGVIVVLSYFGRFVDQNAHAISTALKVIVGGFFVLATLAAGVYFYRRGRQW